MTSQWVLSDNGNLALPPNGEEFVADLKRAAELVVRVTGRSRSETAVFDLTGLFDTPVQPNLDHCGEY